jgi:hypothetical protein
MKTRLLVHGLNQLQVIDLTTQQPIHEISSVRYVGADISGDIVVWSDLQNEQKSLADISDIDKAKADIYMVNLKTGKQSRITTDSSPSSTRRSGKTISSGETTEMTKIMNIRESGVSICMI